MKFLGKYRQGCQCQYCIGNPSSTIKNRIRKSQKSAARQLAKKEIREVQK